MLRPEKLEMDSKNEGFEFDMSKVERAYQLIKETLQKALQLSDLKNEALEIYYNGEFGLT